VTLLVQDRDAVAYGAGGAIDGSVAEAAAVAAAFDERRDEGSTSA
jgi:hypothetical protein